MRKLRSFAAVVAFATVPAIALADSLPPPPAAPPMPVAAANDSSPLREIGHVTAKTSLCTAFSEGGAPAAESALRFERRLAVTTADFNALDLGHELAKQRSIRLLEEDALALALDARDGRGELATMRKNMLANPDPNVDANKALVAFADALRGAQGREYELSRQLANLVGTLAELPVPSITDASSRTIDSFARPTFEQAGLITDTVIGGATPLQNHFFTIPSNRLIEDDLALAGTHAQEVETLGNCR